MLHIFTYFHFYPSSHSSKTQPHTPHTFHLCPPVAFKHNPTPHPFSSLFLSLSPPFSLSKFQTKPLLLPCPQTKPEPEPTREYGSARVLHRRLFLGGKLLLRQETGRECCHQPPLHRRRPARFLESRRGHGDRGRVRQCEGEFG